MHVERIRVVRRLVDARRRRRQNGDSLPRTVAVQLQQWLGGFLMVTPSRSSFGQSESTPSWAKVVAVLPPFHALTINYAPARNGRRALAVR